MCLASMIHTQPQMVAASGPLQGQPVKMELRFPDTYPAAPPNVRLCTPISNHPNVFGDWICLDMLKVSASVRTT